ncbi:MAG TPA: hypothetical protein VJ874_05720 [Candidatus Thermoplasmatota archaeon]|nr:hypothetical protein [Candidatus Thermoplasmatota archaeon]
MTGGGRSLALLVLLSSLALAGCGGKDGGGHPATDDCELEPVLCDPENYLASHHCIANDVRPRVYAPDTPGPDTAASPWNAGDWWTYRLTIGGRSHETTLVYYEDTDFDSGGRAQHYLVGTSSPEEALDHALFSVNPMLGRIHRTLYSPHESGLHADMFNFPLCDGATWVTGFYGTTFDLVARQGPLDLPRGGTDPLGFVITGASGDGSSLLHTYSPQAKWFTRVQLDRADGLELDMELLDHGSGKTGTYHFLRAQQDEVLDLAAIDDPIVVGREDGGEGPYTTLGVWIDAQRTAGSGRIEVHLRNPAGQSMACVGFDGQGLGGDSPCPGAPLKAQVPYQAGEWTVTVDRPLGALDGSTQVGGQMRIVSIYDRSGTV